jgi:hypothetical protein
MSQPDPVRPEPGPDAGIDELQTDIEQTRKELGQTVENLSAKLDVKQRTKDKAVETREAVVDKAHAVQHATLDDGRAKLTVPIAVVAVLGAAAAVWLVSRRRR